MAKLQVYKFVNPGVAASASPVVTAARSQVLATNRVGSTISSIGSIFQDLEKISIAQIKDDKLRDRAERRRQRRLLDAASEEAIEASPEVGKLKKKPGSKLKNAAKKSLSWVEKFLGPIGNFLLKLGTLAITKEILEWLGDEENKKKLKDFLDKTKFVFDKLVSFGKAIGDAIGDGLDFIFGKETTIEERLEAFGKIAAAIGGIAVTLKAANLARSLLDTGEELADRNPARNLQKASTAASAAQTAMPLRAMARSTAAGNQRAITGALYRAQLSRVVQPGQLTSGLTMGAAPGTLTNKLRGFQANLQTGTANVPLSPALQKGLYKAGPKAQELASKASSAAKSMMSRIPFMAALMSGIYTYFEDVDPFDGEPDKNLDKALFKAGGVALGGLLGSFIPIPVLGTALGSILGEYVGELFYILIKGDGIEAVGNKLKKDIQALFQAGKLFAGWAGDGFSRFLEGIPKINIFGQKVPDPFFMINPLNVVDKVKLIGKAFFSRDTMDLSGLTKVGDKAIINGEEKYYAGKRYGFQSKESYLKIRSSGQAVPLDQQRDPEEKFLGGVVKGIKKAVGGVGKAIGSVASNPIVQTAASFIPGAAPIMAGVNMATNMMQGNFNPMQMLSSAAGMIPGLGAAMNSPLGQIGSSLMGGDFMGAAMQGLNMIPGASGIMSTVGNFMNGPLGNIAGSLMGGDFMGAATTGLGMINPALGQLAGSVLSGGFDPMSMIGGVADQFGMGNIVKAATGLMGGGDPVNAMKAVATEVGVDPKILGAVDEGRQVLSGEKSLSAKYAMQQAMEFIPIPMIVEKLVPIPQAVPINTMGAVVNATPTAMQTRMR